MIRDIFSDISDPLEDFEKEIEILLKNEEEFDDGNMLWLAIAALSFTEDEDEDERPKRKRKTEYDRNQAWSFVQSWSNDVFQRQFRICREDFDEICIKCKMKYPGPNSSGLKNYELAQKRSAASNKSPITMELKLAITLLQANGFI